MVLPGQFLERPTLIPVAGVVLEGLSHRGTKRPPVLILPPTPDDGGSMDHVVAAEVAWAAATHQHPTLRFNYRGIGGSQGERNSGLSEDAEAALRVLSENAYTGSAALVAIGSSAAVALEVAAKHPAIRGIAFVTPAGVAPEDLTRAQAALLAIVPEGATQLPRAALAAAITEAGGSLEIVPDTGPTFARNLPQVGRSVVRFLQELSS